MKKIFTTGELSAYRMHNINGAREEVNENYMTFNASTGKESNSYYMGLYMKRITVFISHKHDDLDDLKDILGFLEKTYGVKCYIDSRDPTMPKRTSRETAEKIKERIKECDKFILLASNGAIDSKWCNWELGFGDAKKFDSNSVALFPFKRAYESYSGNEYLEIYPHIVKSEVGEWHSEWGYVRPGYYVCSIKNGVENIVPLKDWLEAKNNG